MFGFDSKELNKELSICRPHVFAAGFLSCIIALLQLAPVIYMMQLFNRAMASRSVSTIVMLLLVVSIAVAAAALFEDLRARLLARGGLAIDRALADRVFNAMIGRGGQGGQIGGSQPMRDLETLRGFVLGNTVQTLFDLPFALLFFLIVYLIHPVLALYVCVELLVIGLIAVLGTRATKRLNQESATQSVMGYFSTERMVQAREAVEGMGMARRLSWRWHQARNQSRDSSLRANGILQIYKSAGKALRGVLSAGGLALAVYLVIQQEASAGAVVAMMILAGKIIGPIDNLISSTTNISGVRVAYNRLGDLLAQYQPPTERLALPRPEGHLLLERVVYAPAGPARPIIRGVQMGIPAGDCIGIIGPSAAGKSSLIRLLAGVSRPTAGTIRLDGADIHKWDPDDLGWHIGYVPQSVDLLPGTVAENISRFDDTASAEDIITAAKTAGIHEMILRLPDAYETDLTDNMYVLSMGQRQRIALARALYKEPALLLLDEPNSNLDVDGERALISALQVMKAKRRTIILVTHRPQLLGVTDRVVLMRDGVIEAVGSRDEMMTRMTRRISVVNGGAQQDAAAEPASP